MQIPESWAKWDQNCIDLVHWLEKKRKMGDRDGARECWGKGINNLLEEEEMLLTDLHVMCVCLSLSPSGLPDFISSAYGTPDLEVCSHLRKKGKFLFSSPPDPTVLCSLITVDRRQWLQFSEAEWNSEKPKSKESRRIWKLENDSNFGLSARKKGVWFP